MELINGLFLGLDAIVYNFITYFYKIFFFLSEINLFDVEEFNSIVKKIYIILGVIMLFILAYSLLKAIINPDDFAKGESSFPNLIKNVIISLVVIAILPATFTVANRIQSAILNKDVIGNIILNGDKNIIANGGNNIAATTFSAFFYARNGDNSTVILNDERNLADTFQEVYKSDNPDFNQFKFYLKNTVAAGDKNPEIVYNFFISTIAGAFILWALISYCFDLGIRVIKLLFYQLIAPIPVICKVLPGNKTKDIFPTWVKSTILTFLEVFVRVSLMYLGVLLISIVADKFNGTDLDTGSLGGVQILLVKAFVIMGIVAFISQAPKLIKDLFGIELGGAALNPKSLMERFKKSGALAVGAGVGSFAKNGTRNAVKAWKQNKGKGIGGVFNTLKSGIGGAASGGVRGIYQGRSASNFTDARNASNTAVSNYEEKQAKKDLDIAMYGKSAIPRYIAKAKDATYSFAGVGSVDELRKEKAKYDRVIGYNSSMKGMYGSEIDRIDQEITKTNAGTHGMLSGRTFDLYNEATDKDLAMAQITTNRVSSLKDEFEHKSKSEQTSLQHEFVNKLEGAEKTRVIARVNALKASGVHDQDAKRQVYMDEIAKEQASYEFKSGFRDVEALKLQQDQIKVDKLKKNPETILSTMGQLVSDLKMNPEIEAALVGAGVNVNKFKNIKTQVDLRTNIQTEADYLEVANFFKKASDLSQDKSSKIAADIVRVQESKK